MSRCALRRKDKTHGQLLLFSGEVHSFLRRERRLRGCHASEYDPVQQAEWSPPRRLQKYSPPLYFLAEYFSVPKLPPPDPGQAAATPSLGRVGPAPLIAS
jgi:hypothetical protein